MRLISVILGTCFLSVTAQAGPEAFFVKIPGITGESTTRGYEGWIPATSFSEGFVTSGLTSGFGGGNGSGRSASRLVCQAMQIVKQLDSSSPMITADVATGQTFGEIDLAAVSLGSADVKFLTFALHNAVISSVTFGGDSSTSARVETLSVVAHSVDISYWPQDEKGATGAPVTATVNCFGFGN